MLYDHVIPAVNMLHFQLGHLSRVENKTGLKKFGHFHLSFRYSAYTFPKVKDIRKGTK